MRRPDFSDWSDLVSSLRSVSNSKMLKTLTLHIHTMVLMLLLLLMIMMMLALILMAMILDRDRYRRGVAIMIWTKPNTISLSPYSAQLGFADWRDKMQDDGHLSHFI